MHLFYVKGFGFCILLTGFLNLPGTASVFAAEVQDSMLEGNRAAKSSGGEMAGTVRRNMAAGFFSSGGGINIRRGQVYMYDGAKIMHCKARHGGGIMGSPDSLIELKGNPKVFGNTA